MKLKHIKNCTHLIRFLSFMCLLGLLSTQSLAQQGPAATQAGDTGNKDPLPGQAVTTQQKATTQQTTKQKPAISFQQAETIPELLQSGKIKIKDIPDPHWNKNGCIACHTKTATLASRQNLRYKQAEKTCANCHSPAFDHRYIHPVDVQPDKKMLARMDQTMRTTLQKTKNRITCTTCHDMTIQCQSGIKKQKFTNPKFFRNGPFESRSQLCFLCHDKSEYQRLDPHDQINKQGKLRPEKCRICHADSIERLNHVTDIDQLQFNTKESLSTMCWGCHPWTPHPGGQFTFFKNRSGPDHLAVPPENIKQRMDEMTQKNQVTFPLEPESGKVFCGTCHNVHEKGVIKNPEKAKGADSKKRLRDQDICDYCHLK